MNLSESMKFVLKNKGPELFSELWHEDIKGVLKGFQKDLIKVMLKAPNNKKALRSSLFDLKDMVKDAMVIVGELPGRLKIGFATFREGFLEELEKLSTPKEKTLFCMKIAGALTSYAVTALYGVRTAKKDIRTIGLGNRTAFTQFLVAELVLRFTHFFVLRFIREIEKQVDNPEELKNIRFFKKVLSSKPTGDELNGLPKEEAGDPAFTLVNNLNNYILTGKQ
jgi:hypothetical protein